MTRIPISWNLLRCGQRYILSDYLYHIYKMYLGGQICSTVLKSHIRCITTDQGLHLNATISLRFLLSQKKKKIWVFRFTLPFLIFRIKNEHFSRFQKMYVTETKKVYATCIIYILNIQTSRSEQTAWTKIKLLLQLSRVYTVCHSASTFKTHQSIIKQTGLSFMYVF